MLLELRTKLGKVAGYKTNTSKSCAPLYTNNEGNNLTYHHIKNNKMHKNKHT